MLRRLYIRNYALLDEVEVHFGPGLNVITGETGAGKSIIIDALSTILGEKADADVIRAGAEKAVVEGGFAVPDLPEVDSLLRENLLDDRGEELILRRELHLSGRSRAFVNDTPVPLKVLEELGDLLVDLHGQHEHQSLFRVREHLYYLDAFGQLEKERAEVHQQYELVQQLTRRLTELKEEARQRAEKRALYEFQLKEIQAINPERGEDQALEREECLARNRERLFALTEEVSQQLYEGEGAASERLHRCEALLAELRQIDESFAQLAEMCESARIAVEEIAKSARAYQSHIDFSPSRLEEIRERLARLSGLKKRYGGTLDVVLEYKELLERELALGESQEEHIAETERRLAAERDELARRCLELSAKRRQAALALEQQVVAELAKLGMSKATFVVQMGREEDPAGLVTADDKRYRVTPRGIDLVEFFISTNPGEPVRPLAKVASGGEISRIMLALKSVLAGLDRVPVLIFDEIDIGISGRIAQVVGRSLRGLGRNHQVISITHLPQIASMGDRHYVVEKRVEGDRTYTVVRVLTNEERPAEIAKLLGGETVTEAHLEGARQLLAQANDVRQ
ncbi:MAG: DNA repair protein RecN [bacterium]|jgi:DNA repair protein RecN (Recombination protein N)|nr:DNA repair protein RecN [candidate division KSB1 bacterium]MDH7558794.1 DNA repair protein RecN [bacterium]